MPDFNVQYGPLQPADPNAVVAQNPLSPMPDAVFNKYLQAVGGAQKAAALTSFTATGTNVGYGPEAADKRPTEIYARAQATKWAQQAFIKASNPGKEDWFGSRLQICGDGNTLAASAQLEDSAAQGIHGKQNDDSAQEAGAVYFFTRTGTTWAQKAYVKGSNNEAFDEFGSSVALSRDGKTMAAGASGEDSSAKGINGNEADNSMKEAGAVYLFSFTANAVNP